MSVKFRNPKTKEVFEVTDCCTANFCAHISDCVVCPIYDYVGGSEELCSAWVKSHPYEAAKLMGYEAVEDIDENKPLKDWTLGELKEYCKNNINKNCNTCPFIHNCKEIAFVLDNEGAIPYRWQLSQHWTKEEIKFAEFLKDYVDNPENIIIKRNDNGVLLWIDMKTHKSYNIPKELFTSIKNNIRIKLTDITNYGE